MVVFLGSSLKQLLIVVSESFVVGGGNGMINYSFDCFKLAALLGWTLNSGL